METLVGGRRGGLAGAIVMAPNDPTWVWVFIVVWAICAMVVYGGAS